MSISDSDLKPGARLKGLDASGVVELVQVMPIGSNSWRIAFRRSSGRLDETIVFSDQLALLTLDHAGRAWAFDADPARFKLAAEALRIRLAHLFDPYLALNTSRIEPLPHQITAVYEEMLPRRPLRFLLADDPGAGKTIMAGLLIKELIARGDVRRCLIVAPGSLVEQWQDELSEKFGLDFDILTRERVEASRTGNPFIEGDRWIARMDQLGRSDEFREKLAAAPEFDLIVGDEAHRMSATYFGSELKKTKRYQLGEQLGRCCRHLLLMSATPHNGKEVDFQLFMALLDADRYEGKFRDGAHTSDASDLMRRLTKEELLRFDGRPLFPERRAYTVKYDLSPEEAALYTAVTDYVREQMDLAKQIGQGDERRRNNVGFALQTLQRRLASSPAAIHESLKRRLERLRRRLEEERLVQRGERLPVDRSLDRYDASDLDEVDDAPQAEVEELEEELIDRATAAQTIAELQKEIAVLEGLEKQARELRHSGVDTKWRHLVDILDRPEMTDPGGHRRKLIVFTEPKDTLLYLADGIRRRIGRDEAVVVIHGGIGREERKKTVEAFRNDPNVLVLVANDAAGEGVNLQRAHLMVNYDLPWNPNRIEQRFGRIHRIGQTEVCHLWNLVAHETREGQVYARLLEKLEAAREALGGRVFDVLGKLFDKQPLRELLMDAILYGERPEVKARLDQVVDGAVDTDALRRLLEDRALATETMNAARAQAIREEMERANARRLQPRYVRSFFLEAFAMLGGRYSRREGQRLEITHVPPAVRARDRQIGTREVVLARYERICFDAADVRGPSDDLIAPGHPLLDAVVDLVREQHGRLLQAGTVLVDDQDLATEPRLLLILQHAVTDGQLTPSGDSLVVSERLELLDLFADGTARAAGPAPYLDLRPPTAEEAERVDQIRTSAPLASDPETRAMAFAIEHLVPEHLREVKAIRLPLIDKAEREVTARLTKEIESWEYRAEELREQELKGKQPAMNAARARARAAELEARLRERLDDIARQRQIAPKPPQVIGAALVVPCGLLRAEAGEAAAVAVEAEARALIERLAMEAVMAAERALGFEPIDVSARNCGYDIESRGAPDGRLRLIEVKGRRADATTVTVTCNEVITGLNAGASSDYILAIVEVREGRAAAPRYVRDPFDSEPGTDEIAKVLSLPRLLQRA
ncbi:MAG: helicase-related protein, partial [Roseicyclus sp.]